MPLTIFYWRGFVTDKALLINRVLVSSSLLIACLATLLCPLLIMAGLFTRITTAVALIATLTGLLLVHAHDPLRLKDTPYIYSVALITLFLLGPGRYSIDHLLSNKKST